MHRLREHRGAPVPCRARLHAVFGRGTARVGRGGLRGSRPPGGAVTTAVMSAAAWLAQAHDTPQRLLERWERMPSQLELLPVGQTWDLVAMRDDLGQMVLDVLNPQRIPGAPVLRDACGKRTFFFAPPGSVRLWDVEAAIVLGAGHWLPVPHPQGAGNAYSHWLVRPDGSGTLYHSRPLGAAIEHVYPSYARRNSESLDPVLRLIAAMGGEW